jgi:WD40 repeat protein
VAATVPIVDGRWSPEGALLAAITKDRKTLVYDAATGKRIAVNDGELYWHPSQPGARVSATMLLDKSVQLVELEQSATWKILRDLMPAGYAGPRIRPYDMSYELSPEGLRIAALYGRGENIDVLVTDLNSGQVIRTPLHYPQYPLPRGLAWSPQGEYLVANSLTGFSILESRSGAVLFVQDSGSQITVEDVSFSPDGKLLATTDRSGRTWLWDGDVRAKRQLLQLPGEADRAYRPTFSQDGRYLSVIYGNGRARVFSVDGNPEGGLALLKDT